MRATSNEMNWLFNDVTPVLAVSALLEVVLIFALLRSGNKRLLFIIIGIAVVCAGCVLIESLVETEKERVEKAIEKTRQAILTNDLQQVLRTIDPDSRKLQSMADRYLSRFAVRSIKITEGPHLRFFTKTVPPYATVTLNARFDFDPSKGALAYRGGVVRVDAELRQFSGGWKWTDAKFSSPLTSTRNRIP